MNVAVIICGVLVYTFIMYKLASLITRKAVIKQVKKSGLGVFDQNIKDGMNIVDSFIKKSFVKYLNKELIKSSMDTDISWYNFLKKMNNSDEVTKFISGFVSIVDTQMSDDLKQLFSRYYNVIDPETGMMNDIFVTYVAEWANTYYRYLLAKSTISDTNIEDMSTKHKVDMSSQAFMSIELDLYKELNIISEDEYIGGKK